MLCNNLLENKNYIGVYLLKNIVSKKPLEKNENGNNLSKGRE